MKKLTLLKLVVICFALQANAYAASINVSPTASGYIGIAGAGFINGPYSGATFGPLVGKIDHIQSNPSLTVESRGFYEFNLTALAASSVSSASFSFTTTDVVSAGFSCFDLSGCPTINSINVFGYTGDGAIKPSDFNAGSWLTEVNSLPLGSTISIDVTAFISGLVSAGNSFAGFNLQSAVFNGALYFPQGQLTVNYTPSTSTPAAVPLPSALILFASAFGLFGFKKRLLKA